MITAARSAIIAGLLMGVLVGQSRAQQNPAATTGSATFTIFGMGPKNCREFLQAADDDRNLKPLDSPPNAHYSDAYIAFDQYAQGFLSAENFTRASNNQMQVNFNDNFTGELLWLENYCRAHPQDNYGTAVINLMTALTQKGQLK